MSDDKKGSANTKAPDSLIFIGYYPGKPISKGRHTEGRLPALKIRSPDKEQWAAFRN